MEKYNTMIRKNKEKSQVKVNKAISIIKKMLNDDEQVLVCELVKKTGLSRAFFYNNDEVRTELKRAQELQEGKSFVVSQKVILDKAMEKEIELLKRKLAERDKIIEELKKENIKLQKTLENKIMKTLEEL